jgi:hypothetical protein
MAKRKYNWHGIDITGHPLVEAADSYANVAEDYEGLSPEEFVDEAFDAFMAGAEWAMQNPEKVQGLLRL